MLEAQQVPGYSVLHDVTGAGGHGRIEGNRAFPGIGTMLVSVVDDARVEPLRTALREAGAALPPGESLHVAVLPVESFV
ncbi:MAG TPA: hypothetical protein PKE51_12450 [Gemmatimonadaceae bacterium]|nr:hypothetical protein [Gemmatimonadaceae bacterium]